MEATPDIVPTRVTNQPWIYSPPEINECVYDDQHSENEGAIASLKIKDSPDDIKAVNSNKTNLQSVNEAEAEPESIDKAKVGSESIDKAEVIPESNDKAEVVPESIDKAEVVPESIDKAEVVPESIDKAKVVLESTDTAESDIKDCSQNNSKSDNEEEETYVGKWMLFFDQEDRDAQGHTQHDLAWFKIDKLCRDGLLYHAKASTAMKSELAHTQNLGVICCYNEDYRDQDEVFKTANHIRAALAEELCEKVIYYKTDSATLAKKYRVLGSGRVSIYRHKPDYSLWKTSDDNTSWNFLRAQKGHNSRPNFRGNSRPYNRSNWGFNSNKQDRW